MAGRPAPARGGGLSGVHYGMISFAIVSVLATALSVFALTNLKGAEEDARLANNRLRKHGNPPPYYANEADARTSDAFQVMDDHISKMAGLIAGRTDGVWPSIDAEAKELLSGVVEQHPGSINPNDTLLTALGRLSRALADEKDTNVALTEGISDLQTENQSLKEGVKAARDEYLAQLTSLSEDVARLRTETEQQLAQKDEQVTGFQREVEASNEETGRLRTEGERRKQQFDIDLGRLTAQLNESRRKLKEIDTSSFDPQAILTKADGKILRATPGSDVVYINLGENDRLKVGMGFEVFSQTGERSAQFRGKASVEVVNIMADTAECRITRTRPGRPIIEGDVVVNVAYERNRRPKFVVRGDFDLNFDGVMDFDGVEHVTAIIREWGGQVVTELNEKTDFVIIGGAPQVPTLDANRPVSPAVSALAADQETKKAGFSGLVQRAQSMFIPVITQNQFLFLMGYSGEGSLTLR